MVDERLFGNKPWPVEKESTKTVHTTLLELELLECVPAPAPARLDGRNRRVQAFNSTSNSLKVDCRSVLGNCYPNKLPLKELSPANGRAMRYFR
jgi:hypothetical protein